MGEVEEVEMEEEEMEEIMLSSDDENEDDDVALIVLKRPPVTERIVEEVEVNNILIFSKLNSQLEIS